MTWTQPSLSEYSPNRWSVIYPLTPLLDSGMRTIYIKRPTEDASDPITEESAKGRFDMFIDIGGEENGGLVALAEKFGL